ncbi:UPF0481 protein At3g47200-like [Impatiens glandulifera]|uniref:UPF0481 protein At3g47200-like n=1 Tax=Impatiens glandulifera TaxID=253017 RepID=UPI001FB0FEE4|nr:UPF0481 protein At3g47200-like [Impatiens glandulifera]
MEMVEIENSSEWVIKVQDNVDQMDNSKEVEFWKKRSIYRIPDSVININKKAYNPQFVSFGPYHHGEEHLKSMEDHKERALLHFLKRSKKPLNLYVQSLSNLVKDLKESYDSLDAFHAWNDDAFLKLMILDGCFMLEVMRTATQTLDDYAHNDPIFSNHGKLNIVPYIRRDMLMLENQLPFSLLCNLVAIENGKFKDDERKVIKLVLKFYSLSTTVNNITEMNGKSLHILDIFRKSLLWQDPKKLKKIESKNKLKTIHEDSGGGGEEIVRSAMELNEAGIQFKKNKSGSLKDITFKRGSLKLPLIVVDDATESMFLNLIAFERFHVDAGNEVTSYIFFMDNIIDNAKDVSLLHSRGIIQNAIGSDKAVAKLFNSLSKDVTLDPNSGLDRVHKKVHRYCKKSWNEWRANLIHTYFRSPWAILSVIAAIVLFALTIAQTIYTVYPYYHPSGGDSSSPPPSTTPKS